MCIRISAKAPDSSTPVGPPPTTTKVSSACRSSFILVTSAFSRFCKINARKFSASGQVLHGHGIMLNLLAAEKVGIGAGCNHQVIILNIAYVRSSVLVSGFIFCTSAIWKVKFFCPANNAPDRESYRIAL